MEIILAIVIGILTSGGLYLLLEARRFPMLLGAILLSQAATLFLLSAGGISIARTAIVAHYIPISADPVPQALTLAFLGLTLGLTVAALVLLCARGRSSKDAGR